LSIVNNPFTFPTILSLFDSSGRLLAFGDVSTPLKPGSASTNDSYIGSYTLLFPGRYFVAVSNAGASIPGYPDTSSCTSFDQLTRPDGGNGGISTGGCDSTSSAFVFAGDQPVSPLSYTLLIADTPEPGTLVLAAMGLIGAALWKWRKVRFRKEIVHAYLAMCLIPAIMMTGFSSVTAGAASVPLPTITPIKHLVVIFNENISFDHYFGTYPNALNPAGEPVFTASTGTPAVNNYVQTPSLLIANPNFLNISGNGAAAVNPFRLGRAQARTADQGHNYRPEQLAFNNANMDLFPASVGVTGPPPTTPSQAVTKGLTMAYYDGNTVTALWNYAQHFAMSDNSFNSTFGPSTPGAINLISGQTNGIAANVNGTANLVADGNGNFTLFGDDDPLGDVCSTTTGTTISMAGRNIGDLLNTIGATWGWFQGGFDLKATNPNGTTGCTRTSSSAIVPAARDYVPHHEPFQYYPSTANPLHLRPTSPVTIGHPGDAANHQYDLKDFYTAIQTGNMPAVSFLKAPAFQNGHAGNSDPLDEQAFVVPIINFLQTRPEWASTAIIIAYDDSDGWYDHVRSPTVNGSSTAQDALNGTGICGSGSVTGATALPGVNPATLHAQGRCGYGPRLPLLVISPWARVNFVDHTLTDQSSIIRFIEDNWLNGTRIGQGSFDAVAGPIDNMFDFTSPKAAKLFLDATTGVPLQ
jgi:phospholipase C